MARVAVIGGGISGLGTALMLGRRGHPVTLFEQDARQAGEDLDGDFFHWHRPRTPQAVQPHSLLAPVRTVLRAEAPDVYADLLTRGAREYHEFDWFGEHPPHRDGDDDLVTLRSRRIVLEAALTAAVRREPTVVVRRGCRVRGLTLREGRPHGSPAYGSGRRPSGRTSSSTRPGVARRFPTGWSRPVAARRWSTAIAPGSPICAAGTACGRRVRVTRDG